MVLGLIDFLLGGKKKTKVPKSGQVTTPMNTNIGGANPNQGNEGNFQPEPMAVNPVENNVNQVNQQQVQPQQNPQTFNPEGGRKSVAEVLVKINSELKATNEKITGLVTDVKMLENSVNTLGHRIDDLEEAKKVNEEKFSDIDANMSKFLSLYELVNNQYNPFVENEPINSQKQVKQITIDNMGNSGIEDENNLNSFQKLPEVKSEIKNLGVSATNDLDSSLLELDTLNIEEAAGDAVPLTRLKNNTNSLVIILSWLEYLIKRVGVEETRNTLRYYTEILRWTTPEVYFDLDKYLRGMKDKKNLEGDEKLNVKDHIVSLYFISKLNEKTLDDKLTKAVLQIIKQ